MATTGTYAFNMSIDELLEEAAQLANLNLQEANGLWVRSGKNTIDLLLRDWVNRGVKLWTLEFQTINLTQGQQVYTLPAQFYDVLDVGLRIQGADRKLDRFDVRRWLELSVKDNPGEPNSYLVQRPNGPVTLTLNPVPDQAGYTLTYWGMRITQDSSSMAADVDAPQRFWPALVMGVAVDLVRKSNKPIADKQALIADLKREYEERLLRAMEEDAERASFYIRADFTM